MDAKVDNIKLIHTIINRVRSHINTSLSSEQCIQLAIASSMRDRNPVVGFMMPHNIVMLVESNCDLIKLNESEWKILFGYHISPINDFGMSGFVSNQLFVHELKHVEKSIELTIMEHEPAALWKKPWHQLVVYVALHLEFAESAISESLGTIIKSDRRKIEELVNEIDDDEIQTILLVETLELISRVLSNNTPSNLL